MSPARILLLAACLALAVPVFAQDDAKTPAPYASDPKYIAAFNEARNHRQNGEALPARDGFVKANKIAGGACVPCLNRVYELDIELRDYKHAIATAQQLIPLSPNPREKSVNEGRQGDAMLQAAGDKPKPEQLEAVHVVMQAALADHPKNQKALWDDAFVLARMNHTDEAKSEFTKYVERAASNDPKRVRATHFAENPELAKLKMAPPFEVKTMDGTVFNLDEMGGKVVLLDFWATWCGPCQESLPELRHLAKEFAGQPFVLLSISGDDDGKKWREFVDKNQMTWLQYRDRDDHVSKLFDAHLIPHYFIIDSDGVLTTESVADNTAIEGKIKKLIKRANESAAAQSAAKGSN